MNTIDLSSDYLGLKLSSPLTPTLPSLDHGLDEARQLEDAGAAAIVMHPMFEAALHREEEAAASFFIHPELGHAEAHSFLPFHENYRRGEERHLQQLITLKEHLDIPVIASLNAITPEGWLERARALQQAGADAIELNACYLAVDTEETVADVEKGYAILVRELHSRIDIPIALSFPPWFSALPHFAAHLAAQGAAGIVFSTPRHEPDIDPDSLRLTVRAAPSPGAPAALRWIGILHGRVGLSLTVSEGVGSVTDILKLLLAGADAVRPRGDARILAEIRTGIHDWMEGHGFHSVNEFKGLLSQRHAADPAAYGDPGCLLLFGSAPSCGGSPG